MFAIFPFNHFSNDVIIFKNKYANQIFGNVLSDGGFFHQWDPEIDGFT